MPFNIIASVATLFRSATLKCLLLDSEGLEAERAYFQSRAAAQQEHRASPPQSQQNGMALCECVFCAAKVKAHSYVPTVAAEWDGTYELYLTPKNIYKAVWT